MPVSTKVYVLLWDQHGWGKDTLLGVYSTQEGAEKVITGTLSRFPNGRYVKSEFLILEREIE